MQTSQVSNAANVLTATSAPNKQSDANPAAEPFEKVLSREVSQRNSANEAPKNKETGNAPASQQGAKAPVKQTESRAPAKQGEAKAAKEGKPADKAQADEETTETASVLPDELLALVANVNSMIVQPETQTSETEALPAEAVTADTTAADTTMPIAAAVLPGAAIAADTAPAETTTPLPTAAAAIGTQTEATTLSAAGAAIKQDKPGTLPVQADRGARVELPATASAQAAVKTEEAAAQPAATKAQDFATAMSETLNGVTSGMQPMQQAGLHAVQQQGAQSAEKLTPRVGTPAWDQAVGQKIVWMVGGEQQSASLTLNPPDLGPLQVVLNVSNSQANATFIAAQPEVRQALEAALPKLREMLGEAGIQLGQASINSGAPNQQGSFEQQASSSSRGHGMAGNREAAGNEGQARVSRVQPSSSGLGLVDTFA